MRRVVKYDYRTNELLATYNSVTDAAQQNPGEKVSKITLMCSRKNGIKSPRRSYYFRYEGDPPEQHTIIGCYDEDFNLLDTYCSKTETMNKTGLAWTAIYGQLRHTEELRNRKCPPTSGLYLRYIDVK